LTNLNQNPTKYVSKSKIGQTVAYSQESSRERTINY